MIGDEAGNEIIAVIVAVMPSQLEIYALFAADRLEPIDIEFLLEELVGQSLVNENSTAWRLGKVADDFGRVVLAPGGADTAKVVAEGLLSPRAVTRITDGCERGNGNMSMILWGIGTNYMIWRMIRGNWKTLWVMHQIGKHWQK